MSDNAAFLKLNLPCDKTVDWLKAKLNQAGTSIMQTFDLQEARCSQKIGPCPQHGTDQCDCQMVILLVYVPGHQPVTILVQGRDGETWISIVDSPQQHADPQVEEKIYQLMPPICLAYK